ncbi:MAG: hypothetical protein GXO43_09825 [Crenarchaeota archaeon]|nr:hypothetical protein [Thermoproteota archaeon]
MAKLFRVRVKAELEVLVEADSLDEARRLADKCIFIDCMLGPVCKPIKRIVDKKWVIRGG